MLTAGDRTYTYDEAGNLVSKTDDTGTVQYEYSPAGKMSRVAYEDGTDVRFEYDGLGRKVRRLETYWQEKQGKGPSEMGLEHGQGFTQGQRNGVGKDKTNNGNGKGNGKGQAENPLKLREEDTAYLYDGLLVFQEFTGEGSPLGEYLRGNDQVASRRTFGFHGRKDEGREGNVRTRGGLMYYGYDGLGSVTDLTDRTGDVAMKYRYDAFGGLFTGITSPYNTVGYTGKSYDPKASLIEFYARWYDPSVGRFTTQDSYLGTLMEPASQHRYAYVLNNPVSSVDRWGYMNEGDSGGDASFSEWYTHESEYSYTNERTVTSTSTKTEGNYRVTYEVQTVYADKWKVVKTYYHNSLGTSYFYDESPPQSLGTVVRSSSRTEIGREEIPTGDGQADDDDDDDDDDDPKDEDVTDPVDGGGGGYHEPTPAEKAAWKRQLLLQLHAGLITEDEYLSAAEDLLDTVGITLDVAQGAAEGLEDAGLGLLKKLPIGDIADYLAKVGRFIPLASTLVGGVQDWREGDSLKEIVVHAGIRLAVDIPAGELVSLLTEAHVGLAVALVPEGPAGWVAEPIVAISYVGSVGATVYAADRIKESLITAADTMMNK